MRSLSPSDNRPNKGMKYGKLPSGSDSEINSPSCCQGVWPGQWPGIFWWGLCGGKKRKQSVNPQRYSMILNTSGGKKTVWMTSGATQKRIITEGRPSCVSMTTSDLGQQTHLHFHRRKMLYKGADERQELPMGSEDRIACVKSYWWAHEFGC